MESGGLRTLCQVDHASSFVNEVHRKGRRGLHREPGAHCARLLCFLIRGRGKKVSSLDGMGQSRHLKLHGEASNTRLRGLGPKR